MISEWKKSLDELLYNITEVKFQSVQLVRLLVASEKFIVRTDIQSTEIINATPHYIFMWADFLPAVL